MSLLVSMRRRCAANLATRRGGAVNRTPGTARAPGSAPSGAGIRHGPDPEVPVTATQRRFAVVTGASSGIGLELTKQFVGAGFDVLMVAEDDGLAAAAAAVRGSGGSTETLQLDLTARDSVEQLWQHVQASGRPLDAVAINAGVGNAGAFVDTPLDADFALIELNVRSAVHLAKRVLPGMVARREGRILFTSSLAATMPGPYYATYAASKAFVQSFAEAVRDEVADAGVTITALMPGPTDTNFFARARMWGSKADEGPKDDPAVVARDGFEALMAGKDHVVPGAIRNTVQAVLGKLLPQKLTAKVHGAQAKPGTVDGDTDGAGDA
jgi:short-subunit dehydrogenase